MNRRWLAAALCVFLTAPASAEIYTVFSDVGLPNVPPNTVSTYSGNLPTATFNGQSTDITPPEGYSSWKTTQSQSTFTGWGLAYSSAQNLSRFNSGELRFWIYSNDGNIQIEIKAPGGTNGVDVLSKNLRTDLGWNSVTDANQWRQFRISLAGVTLSNIQNPFLFTELSNPVTFYVDNVRYVDGTVSSPYFNISLHNISGNVGAGAITWNTVNLPNSFVSANQYIQLDVDGGAPLWGVQIYTDNMNAAASPQFVSSVAAGQPGSNPAGLVNTSIHSQQLPLAWSIQSSLSTPPTAADPNAQTTDSFQWLFTQDLNTPSIPSENTNVFSNGEPYAQVKNNLGIHFNQGISPTPSFFGAENSPAYIYLEADFSHALTPLTYKTSTLTLEFFYL